MHSEQFMVGQVVVGGELHEASDNEAGETWHGRFEVGDEVLRVAKLEPILPGSLTFENRDVKEEDTVLVFADDVRVGLRAPGDEHNGDFTHTEAPHAGTRHNPKFPRIKLTAAAHSTILQMISPVVAARKDDPHNLIGMEYVDEENGHMMKVEGLAKATGAGGRVFKVRDQTEGGFEALVEGYLVTKAGNEWQPAAQVCKCGSATHKRTNHSDCPLNKKKGGVAKAGAGTGAGASASTSASASDGNATTRIDQARRVCGVVARRKVACEQKCAWLLEVDDGKHLTTFAASTARKEMWLDANEALTAFKNTEFNSVCVITVSGKDAKVAIAVQGEKQFCLEQGKYLTGPRGKCFPDPRKTTVIIYNGTNHYCGVVGAGTAEKPGDEDGLSITTPKIVDDWLEHHGCVLWPSTGKGFCGYESLAMSRAWLLAQAEENGLGE